MSEDVGPTSSSTLDILSKISDMESMNSDLDIALCVPIYQPNDEFFTELKKFNSGQFKIGLIILETLSSPAEHERIIHSLKLLEDNFSYITIETIDKKDFNHSTSRNRLVKIAESADFLIFTTQDVVMPENACQVTFLEVSRMIQQNLNAVCFRHESPIFAMNFVFDNIFKNLPYDKYLNGTSKDIYWWSNNFAIYKKSNLQSLPFPESVSWAEDLAWAKLARQRKLRLRVITNVAIKHLNDDSVFVAYKRGIDNGKGIYEIANLLKEEPPHLTYRKDLFRAALGMTKLECRRAKVLHVPLLMYIQIIREMVPWSFQALGRIHKTKLLAKSEHNEFS